MLNMNESELIYSQSKFKFELNESEVYSDIYMATRSFCHYFQMIIIAMDPPVCSFTFYEHWTDLNSVELSHLSCNNVMFTVYWLKILFKTEIIAIKPTISNQSIDNILVTCNLSIYIRN